MVSFEFQETMSGSLRVFREAADAPMSFAIRGRSRHLVAFLRHPTIELEGEVNAEGFADHRPLRGTIDLGPLWKRRIPYTFAFTGNDCARYTFSGQKTLSPGALLDSFSILSGELRDAGGALVGRALLRFDVRSDALRYLKSFRPSL
jgi:hypothetical protein